jgi:cytochrome c oxidase cbb3-type subunit 2
VGSLTQTTETLDEDGNPIEGETLYPMQIVGLAQQGKQVYIEMGCVYCHSQQVRRQGFGADYERNWGPRQTVARDYIMQDRVLLGTMRTGPDLMHVGGRPLNADWHHLHLYNPQITSPGSTMAPFPFLYETQKIGEAPASNALKFPPDSDYAPEPGYEIVPTRKAEALVEYLLSLKVNYSLPEAPILE